MMKKYLKNFLIAFLQYVSEVKLQSDHFINNLSTLEDKIVKIFQKLFKNYMSGKNELSNINEIIPFMLKNENNQTLENSSLSK